jgi:hypothetical protein
MDKKQETSAHAISLTEDKEEEEEATEKPATQQKRRRLRLRPSL